MPQLDKFTYLTQFFWFCLFFFSFYIFICNDGNGVLGISRILKLRNQLLSHRGKNIRSKDPNRLEDILRKGFSTGLSYMYSSLFEVSKWCRVVHLFNKKIIIKPLSLHFRLFILDLLIYLAICCILNGILVALGVPPLCYPCITASCAGENSPDWEQLEPLDEGEPSNYQVGIPAPIPELDSAAEMATQEVNQEDLWNALPLLEESERRSQLGASIYSFLKTKNKRFSLDNQKDYFKFFQLQEAQMKFETRLELCLRDEGYDPEVINTTRSRSILFFTNNDSLVTATQLWNFSGDMKANFRTSDPFRILSEAKANGQLRLFKPGES